MAPTPRVQCGPVLETTDFDRTTSSLLAILFCLLLSTFKLSFIWFSNLEPRPPAIRIFPTLELLGGSPSITAQALDVLPPDQTTDDPSVQASPSVAAELIAMVERLGELEPSEVQEPGLGAGTGAGDLHGPGSSIVPPIETNPERWFFNIDCEENADAYAKMLEELGIQIGAFDARGFCYLSRLSEPRPTVLRVTSGKDERFYTLWQGGSLASLDRALFRRADISLTRGEVLHFFSPQLEARLSQMELDASRNTGRRTKDIRRTYFTIAKQTNGQAGVSVARQIFRD